MDQGNQGNGNGSVTQLKGFRQPPKPTKGQVAKENEKLSGQVMGMLQFLNQQLMNLMRRSQQHSVELGALSELLGYENSTEPAAVGDKALVSFLGRMLNDDGSIGDPFDGGFSRLTLIGVGSGQFIPGFEEALVGIEPGFSVTVDVTFPDSYPEQFKGKKATFKVDVFRVYKPVGDLHRLENEYLGLLEEATKKKLAAVEAAKAAINPGAAAPAESETPASEEAPAESEAASEEAATEATPNETPQN